MKFLPNSCRTEKENQTWMDEVDSIIKHLDVSKKLKQIDTFKNIVRGQTA
ncbi:hypothetical protein GLW08_04530 [Pontibacillus yanchengensis]|uniref:Uncharacterized protein n=1 Tax=Pontibacillus yanchengensis TaxID=462910 RepID=A0ACC7VEP5_9BACI|nr:hypothetical protein [Pontibacillus yanchengensis]